MSRIFDLGAVATTATCDRADSDLFKMQVSGNISLTFSGHSDGDVIVVEVENTDSVNLHFISMASSCVFVGGGSPSSHWAIGPLVKYYLTFRYFDGVYVEVVSLHS